MKKIKKVRNKFLFLLIFFCGLFSFVHISSAHQPRIVFGETKVVVDNPEISKAFYGELQGQPNFFEIHSEKIFNLYVNILLPDVPDVQKDISIEIRKDGQLIQATDGANYNWKNFYEPFGGDNYLKGSEFRMQAQPGDYEIKVINHNNSGKYSLTIGEKELFPASEALKALVIIPTIKREFFGESILSAYLNQGTLILIIIIVCIISVLMLLTLAYRGKNGYRQSG